MAKINSSTVFPCCWSVQVSIKEKEYRVAKGDDVTLTCTFTPANPIKKNFVLAWDVVGAPSVRCTKSKAEMFSGFPVDIAPSYEGRATLVVDVDNGVATLLLKKLTMEDSRYYQCSVRIPNDDEGTPIASTSVLVLEPPSKPVCTLQGQAEYFADITLTCKNMFMIRAGVNDGVLSLFNITKETSGFFICLSKNNIGSASCNFTLAVMPHIAPQSNYTIGGAGKTFDDDQHSYRSGLERHDGKGSDIDSQRYQGDRKDYYRGSRDHLDDQRDHYGSRDRDDQRNRYGSRDRLDDQRDRHGSRDRLEDQRDRYGSRDRLDDQRDRYGSRDRLDDQRERYGSRDRLDDQRDRHGSRDRLDDQRIRSGSRDRLDDYRDQDLYRGNRDRIDY
uniref:Glycoprotein A33 n=1 Tax=Poecilia reticulata TaxID=8081 RepID=A0A3P9NXS0_POERE